RRRRPAAARTSALTADSAGRSLRHRKRAACAACSRRLRFRSTVLAALRLAHDEFTALELDVLDPQSQRLHETQPAAVEQARDQPWSTLQLRQQCERV